MRGGERVDWNPREAGWRRSPGRLWAAVVLVEQVRAELGPSPHLTWACVQVTGRLPWLPFLGDRTGGAVGSFLQPGRQKLGRSR